MSYTVYKVAHLVAILFLFTSFGGMVALARNGSEDSGLRKLALTTHGLSLAVILVAGFGLLARLGMTDGFPGWAMAKVGIWLLLGGALVAIKRRPGWAGALWLILPALGGTAAWLAIAKPF